MAKKTDNPHEQSYRQLQAELDGILEWFESDDFDVEQAADKFEAAMVLMAKLEEKLTVTKNTIERINLQEK